MRIAKRAFQSRIFHSVPQWAAMADVEWSPLYGKVAFLNSILHFDGYLLGGAGVVNTETSSLDGRTAASASRADLGLGMRFVAKDFLAVNVALINTSYVDQPLGTSKGAIQNLMTINAGSRCSSRCSRPAGRANDACPSAAPGPLPAARGGAGRPGPRRPAPRPPSPPPPSPPLRPRLRRLLSRRPVTSPRWTRTRSGPCASASARCPATCSSRRAASRSARPPRSPCKDAFFTKYIFGGTLTYYSTETLGCGLRAGYSIPTVSGAAQICTFTDSGVGSAEPRLPRAHLSMSSMASAPGQITLLGGVDVQWAPIYGKISLLAESFLHFDMYGVVGATAGAVRGRGPACGATSSPLGGNVGVGFRFFVNRWMTVRTELRDLIYVEKATTRPPPLRNQLMFELGVSFFFPTALPES